MNSYLAQALHHSFMNLTQQLQMKLHHSFSMHNYHSGNQEEKRAFCVLQYIPVLLPTHSLTHLLTHSLTHALTHALTHSLSLTRSLAHKHVHTHTHTHTIIHSLAQFLFSRILVSAINVNGIQHSDNSFLNFNCSWLNNNHTCN